MKSVLSLKKLAGARVIVSLDYNVPIKAGRVINDAKIKASLLTLLYLLKQGALLLLISHLGRPQGKRQQKYSLKPLLPVLKKLLGESVVLWSGQPLAASSMPKSKIVLLENIRFWPEEEKNNQAWAKNLASLGKYYVNEAFANAHREHASMAGLPKYLPAYAGFNLLEETRQLQSILQSKDHPKVAIIGGAKISTKIELLKILTKTMDYILVGGAAANTFLKAKGLPIGSSVFESVEVNAAKKLLNKKIILPIDGVVADKFTAIQAESKSLVRIKTGEMILDIGPETVALFQGFIKAAKLVVWNGPMGYLENPLFRVGDGGIIQALKKSRAKSLVGGGETLLALDYFKAASVPTFCSTGGGAMLDFLASRGHLKSLQLLN